jgi:hypothetical protein
MVVGRLSFAILLRLRNKRYASARLNTSILVPSQIKPKMRISYASFHRKRCSERCWQQYSAKVLRSRRSSNTMAGTSLMLTRQFMLKV